MRIIKVLAGVLAFLLLALGALAAFTPAGKYWSRHLFPSELNLAQRVIDPAGAFITARTWKMSEPLEAYLLGYADRFLELDEELQQVELKVLEAVQALLPHWEAPPEESRSELFHQVREQLSSSYTTYAESYLEGTSFMEGMVSFAISKDKPLIENIPPFAAIAELAEPLPGASGLVVSQISHLLEKRKEDLLRRFEGADSKMVDLVKDALDIESHHESGVPFVRVSHKEYGLLFFANLPDRRHVAVGSSPERISSLLEKVRSAPLRKSAAPSAEVFLNLGPLKKNPLFSLVPLDVTSFKISLNLGPQTSLELQMQSAKNIDLLRSYEGLVKEALAKIEGVYDLKQEGEVATARAEIPLDSVLRKYAQLWHGEIQKWKGHADTLQRVRQYGSTHQRTAVPFAGADLEQLLSMPAAARWGLGSLKEAFEMKAQLSQAPRHVVFSGQCSKAESQLQIQQGGAPLAFTRAAGSEPLKEIPLDKNINHHLVLQLAQPVPPGELQLLWKVETSDPLGVIQAGCTLKHPPFVI